VCGEWGGFNVTATTMIGNVYTARPYTITRLLFFVYG
jgi:hypothetical protein